jgi:signal peptide peptidase-like protein 2B
VFVGFVVVVLLLAFFFRPIAVFFFNVLIVLLGTVSLHAIVYTLSQCCFTDIETFSLGQLFCCNTANCQFLRSKIPFVERLSKTGLATSKIRLVSTLVGVAALGLCLTWFFNREHPYAFVLLNVMNFALCVYAIRGSNIHSLRLLTFLLVAMFVYDIFMVFGTRLLTSSGCSVMVEVVTGVECRSRASQSQANSTKEIYPVPPIDADNPEKIPIVFYFPLLSDPMSECFDLDVEGEFRHVMLGLGDVIVPGYLIAFCFYIDVVKRHRFYSFGVISLIGYSLGMIATFIALRLMETAQPALIYLVPFTLVPISLWACYKGVFCEIWKGKLNKEESEEEGL